MKNCLIIATSLISILVLSGCNQSNQFKAEKTFNTGYEWASENDIRSFQDCQDHFGTGDAENGCNEYIKQNYSGFKTFKGYPCTEDCAGHKAGFNWAEDKNIADRSECKSKSQSFIEGCWAWVDENN